VGGRWLICYLGGKRGSDDCKAPAPVALELERTPTCLTSSSKPGALHEPRPGTKLGLLCNPALRPQDIKTTGILKSQFVAAS
jgi:hypothetical protein